MFDVADAEAFGEFVVREVKEMVADKLRAMSEETALLKSQLADMRTKIEALKSIPGPPGPPGKDGMPGKDGRDGNDGIGLASAFLDRDYNLVVTMTDGTVGTLGVVKGADGVPGKDGRDGKDGKDGRDGLAIEDIKAELTEDGELVHKYIRGGVVVEEHRFQINYMRWVGIYETGKTYNPQNVVTWDGSTWIAKRATSEKPGNGSKDWVLITKRGRDGKDGASIVGPPGPAGRDGRDLTQMGPDGKKW